MFRKAQLCIPRKKLLKTNQHTETDHKNESLKHFVVNKKIYQTD